jgi:hypothetical protein
MASLLSIPSVCNLAAGLWGINSPVVLVVLISVAIGLAMVVVFRYTSDQKAIHIAKDQLKAHLLAVRLYQDQLPVVLRAYGRIIRGTGRYIRLAFRPLLVVIVPIMFMIVQLDRYLGLMPVQPAQPFLVKVRTRGLDVLNEVSLQLPPEVTQSAPAVHIPADNEVVWRLVAEKNGTYDLDVAAGGQTLAKQVVVSPDVIRLSPVRLRDQFWERIFTSGEPALPDSSPIQSIAVTYLPRNIEFAWVEWNWIVLFFVLSLVAGFIFKEALGIEI